MESSGDTGILYNGKHAMTSGAAGGHAGLHISKLWTVSMALCYSYQLYQDHDIIQEK